MEKTTPQFASGSLRAVARRLFLWTLAAACIATVALGAPGAHAGAEDEFNKLFGDDVRKALSAPDAPESLALAQTLLNAAKDPAAKFEPDMLKVICDKAFDLASRNNKGQTVALAAMDLLAEKDPAQRDLVGEKVLAYLQKRYFAAGGGAPGAEARTAAGNELLDRLLSLGDAKADTDPGAAQLLYQRAIPIANAIRPDAGATLRAKMFAAGERAATLKQVEGLKTRLQANTDDLVARDKLIETYVIDLDDPTAAAPLLLPGVLGMRADFLRFVPLAARAGRGDTADEMIDLGDWYKDLADKAAAGAKARLYARAEDYYRRFLSAHAAQDLQAAKVNVALADVDKALVKLAVASAGPGSATAGAGGLDLLKIVRPDKDAVAGKWQMGKDGLMADASHNAARLAFPLAPQGNYELEITLTRRGGDDCVIITLPVGTTAVTVVLDNHHCSDSGFESAGRSDPGCVSNVNGVVLTDGKQRTLVFRVAASGDKARIEVQIDGKALLSWQGAASTLKPSDSWTVPAGTIGIGASRSETTFHCVRLRMLTGVAKTLP